MVAPFFYEPAGHVSDGSFIRLKWCSAGPSGVVSNDHHIAGNHSSGKLPPAKNAA